MLSILFLNLPFEAAGFVEGDDLLDGVLAFAEHGLGRIERVVGRADDVFELHELAYSHDFRIVRRRVVPERCNHLGLVVERIETNPAELARSHSLQQDGRWAQFAARDVDEDRAPFAAANAIRIKIAGIRTVEVHRANHHVRPRQRGFHGLILEFRKAGINIDAQHAHAERLADAANLAADVADAYNYQRFALAFSAGDKITLEGHECPLLLGELAQQGHPHQHGLLGDGAMAIERQVPEAGAGRTAGNEFAEMVVAGATREDAIQRGGPSKRHARNRARRDQPSGRQRLAEFLNRQWRVAGGNMGRHELPEHRLLFSEGFIEKDVKHGADFGESNVLPQGRRQIPKAKLN